MPSPAVCSLVSKITAAIINPLIALIFAAGFLVFVWGIIEFLGGLSSDSESKEHGKLHMLWGVIGMAIMISAYAILKIVAATFSLPVGSC